MDTTDPASLVVYLDGELCLQLRHADGVPGQVRGLLERLDADMDAGIDLGGTLVPAPNHQQRAHFVLHQMLAALAAGNTDFAHFLLTYLSLRWPELRSVQAISTDDSWTVSLETG